MLAVDISRRCGLSRSPRVLELSEIRWLANSTQVETGKSPLPLLLDKHQFGAKLRLDAGAAIGSILDLTAGQDGCIVVHAHFDLVQVERFVLQVTRRMSREPLLFGQHESERPDPDEVIRQCPLKEFFCSSRASVWALENELRLSTIWIIVGKYRASGRVKC